jgi:hypothetical protein
MAAVLEFKREDGFDKLPKDEAVAIADELYRAGRGKLVGNDPDPFIRVFSKINTYQFESINEVYKGNRLKEDIKKCFGGDFGNALLSRCSSKYDYLASQLETAMNSLKADKNAICRYALYCTVG